MHLITGKNGTDHITSANDGFKNSQIFGDGNYIFDADGDFFATKINNNTIRIASGQGIMGGRFFEMKDFKEMNIISGTEGIKRTDLVVIRYTKDANTQLENVELIVITGERASDNPPTPSYHTEKITEGASISDFPIYKVNLNGVVMSFEALFELKQGFSVEFNEPATVEELQSGDTLPLLMGKIKKALTSLLTKVGTSKLNTEAQDLSGAINELNEKSGGAEDLSGTYTAMVQIPTVHYSQNGMFRIRCMCTWNIDNTKYNVTLNSYNTDTEMGGQYYTFPNASIESISFSHRSRTFEIVDIWCKTDAYANALHGRVLSVNLTVTKK